MHEYGRRMSRMSFVLFTPSQGVEDQEKQRAMLINRRTIRIEWGDCDPAGIVFYPRYFEWFDACSAALFEAAGYPRADLVSKQGIAIPMVDTRSRFLIPFRFDDELTVETTITRFGRSSFDIQHRILKGTDLAVECSETRVWSRIDLTGPERLKSQPIPEAVILALSKNTN
jgi:4-hydroxybenzoyl-CoA thioesterase